MGTTYGDMQARIADDMVRDDLASQTQNAIQDAIKLWEGKRFDFNESIYCILTIKGQEYYDLKGPTLLTSPAQGAVGTGELLLEVDSINCRPNLTGRPYIVDQRTQQWFDRYQASPNIAQGIPELYGIYRDQARIFPVPNGVHLLTISGLARLPALANPTDTNAWMIEGEGLIREQAKLYLYRDILRDDAGIKASKLAIYGDPSLPEDLGHYHSLRRKAEAKNMTGRMGAWRL